MRLRVPSKGSFTGLLILALFMLAVGDAPWVRPLAIVWLSCLVVGVVLANHARPAVTQLIYSAIMVAFLLGILGITFSHVYLGGGALNGRVEGSMCYLSGESEARSCLVYAAVALFEILGAAAVPFALMARDLVGNGLDCFPDSRKSRA